MQTQETIASMLISVIYASAMIALIMVRFMQNRTVELIAKCGKFSDLATQIVICYYCLGKALIGLLIVAIIMFAGYSLVIGAMINIKVIASM